MGKVHVTIYHRVISYAQFISMQGGLCHILCVNGHIISKKVGPESNELGQISLFWVRLGQVGMGQFGLVWVRLGLEVGLSQVRFGQVRFGQVRLGQVMHIGWYCTCGQTGQCIFSVVLHMWQNRVMQGGTAHVHSLGFSTYTMSLPLYFVLNICLTK